MPTSTVENYLKSILLEQQEGAAERVSTGSLAAALEVAPGTATAMMKTLAESGLVSYEPYSGVRLTQAGRQLALHVLRRHRLIELFLVKVMKMDWSEVHGEAERLEHVVSDALIERMDEMLGYPVTDPHGDPIPDARGEVEEAELSDLLFCAVGQSLRVARVLDQRPEFLQFLEREGLRPGTIVEVASRNEAADTVELRLDGRSFNLGYRAASKVLVAPLAPSLVE
jgi:DtxR family Mn-dependent transcriptional regulator